jgi:hypothetical protein
MGKAPGKTSSCPQDLQQCFTESQIFHSLPIYSSNTSRWICAMKQPSSDLRCQQPIKIHHSLQRPVPSTPSFTQADVLWLFKPKLPSTSSPQQAPHFMSLDSLLQVLFVSFVILSWGYIRSFGLSF